MTKDENIFLIGSFGASSVLVYGAIQSPMAQPRNLISGHLISAIIGSPKIKVLVYLYIISPVLTGSMILFIVAFLFNNMTPN